MKQIKIILAVCLLAITTGSYAAVTNSKLFSFDENTISQKFQTLNQLEKFVSENNGISLSEMTRNNNPLVSDIDAKFGPETALHIAGTTEFEWGSFIGGVGVGMVACVLGCVVYAYIVLGSLSNAYKGY